MQVAFIGKNDVHCEVSNSGAEGPGEQWQRLRARQACPFEDGNYHSALAESKVKGPEPYPPPPAPAYM